MPGMTELMRHIDACTNAVLPGGRSPFRVDGQQVGWIRPDAAAALDGGISVPAGTLQDVARRLAEAGFGRTRHEAFDVRADPDGPVLGVVDRGALPVLGIQAAGVHLNGLVQRADGPWLWVARRAADKLLDPGKLDHLVAGGVAAGATPWHTLIKEAHEEAGLTPALLESAVAVGTLSYAMDRAEGLRRDRLHLYDVLLPEAFVPEPRDGEVQSFELWPLPQVLDTVRRSDDFKFNVNLVLIDLLIRQGLIQGKEAQQLRHALGR